MAHHPQPQQKNSSQPPQNPEIISWLQGLNLTTPTDRQGRLRLGLNLRAETLPLLENYLSYLGSNDAFIMFTLPRFPDQQTLTWLQAEFGPELRALAPQYLDVFGRWGIQLNGDFPSEMAELSLSAGILTWQGGPLADYFATGRTGSLPDYLDRYARVDRLAYEYGQADIPVRREVCGLHTATMVPASLLVALIALEARLIQAQGVSQISVAYSPNGHLLQDVAALRVLATLIEGPAVDVVCLPWTGGSLLGQQNLNTVAAWTTATSVLGSARCCEVTAVETDRSLTTDQLGVLLDLARGLIRLSADQAQAVAAAAELEAQQIRMEAEAIVNRVLELGDGKVAMGLEPAIAEGSLDLPLASFGVCRGQVLSARDNTGALRFLDAGALPLPAVCKQKHIQLLKERAQLEGRELGISMVIDDVYAYSKGKLVGKF